MDWQRGSVITRERRAGVGTALVWVVLPNCCESAGRGGPFRFTRPVPPPRAAAAESWPAADQHSGRPPSSTADSVCWPHATGH